MRRFQLLRVYSTAASKQREKREARGGCSGRSRWDGLMGLRGGSPGSLPEAEIWKSRRKKTQTNCRKLLGLTCSCRLCGSRQAAAEGNRLNTDKRRCKERLRNSFTSIHHIKTLLRLLHTGCKRWSGQTHTLTNISDL